MKIQIELDEEMVRATAIEAVTNAFTAWNGEGKSLVARMVGDYFKSHECEEKVKTIVASTAESITKDIIEKEVAEAISKIARKHAKRQAELREAQIISAVGKQMELKGATQ